MGSPGRPQRGVLIPDGIIDACWHLLGARAASPMLQEGSEGISHGSPCHAPQWNMGTLEFREGQGAGLCRTQS